MAAHGSYLMKQAYEAEAIAKREAEWREDPTVAGAIRKVLSNYTDNINPTHKEDVETFLRVNARPTLADLETFIQGLNLGLNPQGALHQAILHELPQELRARQKYSPGLSDYLGVGVDVACSNAVERFKAKELSHCIRSLLESYTNRLLHPGATQREPVEKFLAEKKDRDITIEDIAGLIGGLNLNPNGALYKILMHQLPTKLAHLSGWVGRGAEIIDKHGVIAFACEQAALRFNAASAEIRSRATSELVSGEGAYELQARRGSTAGVPGGAHAFLPEHAEAAREGGRAAGGSAAARSEPSKESGAAPQ